MVFKSKSWFACGLVLSVVFLLSGCGKDNPASPEVNSNELQAKKKKMELIGKMLGSAIKKDVEFLADNSDRSSLSPILAAALTTDTEESEGNESGETQASDGWRVHPLKTLSDGSTIKVSDRLIIDPITGTANGETKFDEIKPLSEGEHQERSTLIKMFKLGQPDSFFNIEGTITNISGKNNRYSLSYTLHAVYDDEFDPLFQNISFTTSDNWTGAFVFANNSASGPVKDDSGEEVATFYFHRSTSSFTVYYTLTDDPNQEKHEIEMMDI